jgi:hypothetical protein
VAPFGDKSAYIKSLGIKYNLFRDTTELFAEMEAKLLSVADTLGARKASTLARAMAQQVCTLPQIIYPLQFYSFSEAQHDTLTRLLLRPLRQAKVAGTRLHEEVMTNKFLGGFIADVHTKVQEAKLRLFDVAMAEGGDTRRAMECLCLRLLRQEKEDLFLIASCVQCWVPEKEPPPGKRTEWWAESLVRRAQLNNITLHFFPLPNKRGPLHHRYIKEVLHPLSREARCFLNKFNLAVIEELLVFTNEPGDPPEGCYAGPLPWLLSNGIGPGGRKIYDKILALDLEHDLQGIMDPIPLIREQMYQVSPDSFFRVTGILPDSNVSRRFFKSDPDTNGKEVTRLVVDEVVPSDGRDEMRGSGFTTSLPVFHFLTAPGPGGGSRRVITSKGSYFWKVHAILPFRPVDPPRDLSDSPLIPTFPDKLKDVVSYLDESNVVPTHMSSDAGLDHFTGPPSSVFQVGP